MDIDRIHDNFYRAYPNYNLFIVTNEVNIYAWFFFDNYLRVAVSYSWQSIF